MRHFISISRTDSCSYSLRLHDLEFLKLSDNAFAFKASKVSNDDIPSRGHSIERICINSSSAYKQLTLSDVESIEETFGPCLVLTFDNTKGAFSSYITGSHYPIFFATNSTSTSSIYFREVDFILIHYPGFLTQTLLLKQEIMASQCLKLQTNHHVLYPTSFVNYNFSNSGITHTAFNWLISASDFSFRSDHELIASELVDVFKKSLSSKLVDVNPALMISDGVDSNLIHKCLPENCNLRMVNYQLKPDNLDTSNRNVRNIFSSEKNLTFRDIARAHSSLLGDPVRIQYLSTLAQSSPRNFILNNILALESSFLNDDELLITGCSFPTALCVKHLMTYPYEYKYFDKSHIDSLRRRRYYFSTLYFSSLEPSSHEHECVLPIDFPVDPSYYPLFNILCTGFVDPAVKDLMVNFESKSLLNQYTSRSSSLFKQRIDNMINLFVSLARSRDALKYYDQHTASALVKFLGWMNGCVPALSRHSIFAQVSTPSNNSSLYQAGLNWKVIKHLLSVRFDEILVENPKYHIFRAYQIANKGISYIDMLDKNNRIKSPMYTYIREYARFGIFKYLFQSSAYNRKTLNGPDGLQFLSKLYPTYSPSIALHHLNTIFPDASWKVSDLEINNINNSQLNFFTLMSLLPISSADLATPN